MRRRVPFFSAGPFLGRVLLRGPRGVSYWLFVVNQDAFIAGGATGGEATGAG